MMKFFYIGVIVVLFGAPRNCQNSSPCGEVVYKDDKGTVQSPNFPGDYPNSAQCGWSISLVSGGRIGIAFDKFKIESSATCDFDYVKIFDGPDDTSRFLGQFCGDQLPTVHPTTDSLYIKLITDFSVNESGFSAHWFVVTCADLGGICNATCSIYDFGMRCPGTSDLCCEDDEVTSGDCSASWLKQCADGTCLYQHEECPEENCPIWSPNKCYGSTSCYADSDICNGIADCSTGSDEWNCDGTYYELPATTGSWVYITIAAFISISLLCISMTFWRRHQRANLRRRNRNLTSIINGGDGPISVYHITGNVNVAADPPAYDDIVHNSSYPAAPPAYDEIHSPVSSEPDPGLPSYETACRLTPAVSAETDLTVLSTSSLETLPPPSAEAMPVTPSSVPITDTSSPMETTSVSPNDVISPKEVEDVINIGTQSDPVAPVERQISSSSV